MPKTGPSLHRFWKPVQVVVFGLFFLIAVGVNLSPFFDNQDALLDFGSFYASGLKLIQNENPYDSQSDYIFEIVFPKVGAGGKMTNLNPPVSLPFFRLLAQAEPYRMMVAWQVISVMLYGISVFLLAKTYPDRLSAAKFIWAFMLAGFWHTIVLGQIYAVLLLLGVLGWIFLKQGKTIPAGIAIGILVALKPNFAVWSLFLLVAGYALPALVSILTALVLSAIPAFLYGASVYRQWLEASALRRETLIMPGNNSILGLFSRFSSMQVGMAVAILVVAALLLMVKLKTPTLERTEYISSLGILASLLASPIAWTGYTILLLPIFFSLKHWTAPVLFSAILLAIPFQIVLLFFQTSWIGFVVVGWLYGWGMLSLLGMLVRNTMMTSSIQTN